MTDISKIYFLVEELSIEPVIKKCVEELKIKSICHIRPHQGKQDLRKALPKVIPSLSKQPNVAIFIITDQDNKDCKTLKQEIMQDFESNCHCLFAVCIACQELEAWFLGDMQALDKAFLKFKPTKYINKKMFRDVDSIAKPSKELKTIVSETTVSKVKNAKQIAPHMNMNNNTSASFQYFVDKLKAFSGT